MSDEQPMPGRDLEVCKPRPLLSRMQRAVVFYVGAALVAPLSLSGCTADAPPTGDPSPGSEVASEDSSSSSTASPRTQGVQRLVLPPAVNAMPGTWRETFAVSYGPEVEQLGTSRGGEGGALRYGPESGAPAPDGSWWFLDVAKQRLAHYSSSGAFLEGVQVPPRLLVDGRYFQWQLPHVLANGTLVAFRLTSDAGAMLRLRNGVLDEVSLTAMFSPTYDDGRLLYGTVADGAPLATLDPDTGAITSASTDRLPSGAAFTLTDNFDKGELKVDAATASVRLATVTSSGATAHMGVQMRAGADDSLHLFLVGAGDDDPSTQLVGYTRVDLSGAVTRPEPLTNPFSKADRGSPAQLAIAPGDSTPMLIYVLPDGVHVYRRTS